MFEAMYPKKSNRSWSTDMRKGFLYGAFVGFTWAAVIVWVAGL